ncbi:triose-phosphate isomerase [Candidatus Riflebacteria bacterium]
MVRTDNHPVSGVQKDIPHGVYGALFFVEKRLIFYNPDDAAGEFRKELEARLGLNSGFTFFSSDFLKRYIFVELYEEAFVFNLTEKQKKAIKLGLFNTPFLQSIFFFIQNKKNIFLLPQASFPGMEGFGFLPLSFEKFFKSLHESTESVETKQWITVEDLENTARGCQILKGNPEQLTGEARDSLKRKNLWFLHGDNRIRSVFLSELMELHNFSIFDKIEISDETKILLRVPCLHLSFLKKLDLPANAKVFCDGVFFKESGAYTGEVSIMHLTDFGLKGINLFIDDIYFEKKLEFFLQHEKFVVIDGAPGTFNERVELLNKTMQKIDMRKSFFLFLPFGLYKYFVESPELKCFLTRVFPYDKFE